MDACRNGGVGAGAPTARKRGKPPNHRANRAKARDARGGAARGDSGPAKGGPADRDDPKGEARKARGRAAKAARGPALGGQGGPEGGAEPRSGRRAGGRGEGGEQPPEGATPRTRDRAPTRGGRRPAGLCPRTPARRSGGEGAGNHKRTGSSRETLSYGTLSTSEGLEPVGRPRA